MQRLHHIITLIIGSYADEGGPCLNIKILLNTGEKIPRGTGIAKNIQENYNKMTSRFRKDGLEYSTMKVDLYGGVYGLQNSCSR